MILATPDFGASGFIVLLLLICWTILLAIVLAGVVRGSRLRNSESQRTRTIGLFVVLTSCLIPIVCYLAPPHLVRLIYGNYPIGSYPGDKIQEGMSGDKVEAILGAPQERHKRDDRETYFYWIDSFDIHYCAVEFGPDKRVTNIYGN